VQNVKNNKSQKESLQKETTWTIYSHSTHWIALFRL